MAPNLTSRGFKLRSIICVYCGDVGATGPSGAAPGGGGGSVCECVGATPSGPVPQWFPDPPTKDFPQPIHHDL